MDGPGFSIRVSPDPTPKSFLNVWKQRRSASVLLLLLLIGQHLLGAPRAGMKTQRTFPRIIPAR